VALKAKQYVISTVVESSLRWQYCFTSEPSATAYHYRWSVCSNNVRNITCPALLFDIHPSINPLHHPKYAFESRDKLSTRHGFCVVFLLCSDYEWKLIFEFFCDDGRNIFNIAFFENPHMISITIIRCYIFNILSPA